MRKVLFGGAFDLLHLGHVRAMEEAKKHGDYLIVNVLSDARLSAKNKARPGHKNGLSPVIPEAERVEMVKALKFADEVVCLSGVALHPVPILLEHFRPDVLVVSEEGMGEAALNEARKICAVYAVELVVIPRVIVPSGLDTSKIIKKIRAA